MDDNRESRSLANDVRFTIDKKINFGKNRNEIDFYNFGVEITKSLEPSLYDSISCASSRLFIKINDIKTFVYPYDSIQASCTDFEDSCVIRISSAAIDKLSYDEIKFVIGHEIGHYLLDHSSFEIDKIPELMMISKAREISCDRLGLIACNSYENAISSIIKTQSGLTKINLNISDYLVTSISNIKKSSNKFNYSSHPSLPLRAKSLQLAKNYLLNHFPDYSSHLAFSKKSKIDEKINNDFEKYENKDCLIIISNPDKENDIYRKPRTTPCFARFIFPVVGFDGWLYNCSQSSAPNFRSTALGDLNKSNFWDLFYGYETKNFESFLFKCNTKISKSGCRCDRKEHIVNSSVIESKVFKV